MIRKFDKKVNIITKNKVFNIQQKIEKSMKKVYYPQMKTKIKRAKILINKKNRLLNELIKKELAIK